MDKVKIYIFSYYVLNFFFLCFMVILSVRWTLIDITINLSILKKIHTVIHGFLFSHITWIFDSYSYNKKLCFKIVGEFCEDISIEKEGRWDNVGDLKKQIFYRFMNKAYILHPIALGVLLYAVGGIPYILWGMVK